MCSTFNARARLACLSLMLLLAGAATPMAHAQTLTATVSTDRGCGASAVYQLGERNTLLFRTSLNAQVTLRLQRPDGTISFLLANQPVQGGVTYAIAGIIGNPPGQRVLTLNAVAGSQTAQAQCTYSAQGAPSTLTAALQTNKGCGAGAVFSLGEPSRFFFRTSMNALVTLTLLRPDGTSSTLLANQPVQGGITYVFNGVIGNPLGQRRLFLHAVAGTQTADVECDYSAQATGGPVTLNLSIDRGCGGTYHVGQLITVTYRASASTSLTLLDRHANGAVVPIFTNQPVLAGQTYSLQGIIGSDLGTRTLTLSTPSGAGQVQTTCQFTVVP